MGKQSVATKQAKLFAKWDKRLNQIGKAFLEELEEITGHTDYADSDVVNDLAKTYADELSYEGINAMITYAHLMKLAGYPQPKAVQGE